MRRRSSLCWLKFEYRVSVSAPGALRLHYRDKLSDAFGRCVNQSSAPSHPQSQRAGRLSQVLRGSAWNRLGLAQRQLLDVWWWLIGSRKGARLRRPDHLRIPQSSIFPFLQLQRAGFNWEVGLFYRFQANRLWEIAQGSPYYSENRQIKKMIIFIGPESDHWQCLSVTP